MSTPPTVHRRAPEDTRHRVLRTPVVARVFLGREPLVPLDPLSSVPEVIVLLVVDSRIVTPLGRFRCDLRRARVRSPYPTTLLPSFVRSLLCESSAENCSEWMRPMQN